MEGKSLSIEKNKSDAELIAALAEHDANAMEHLDKI